MIIKGFHPFSWTFMGFFQCSCLRSYGFLATSPGVWSGFINELEAVDESLDAITDALLRLKGGKASSDTLAQLHAMLLELIDCVELSEYRLILQVRDLGSFINSFGAFAALEAAGLRLARYAPDRSVYIFEAEANAKERASELLERLRTELELPEARLPERKLRYRALWPSKSLKKGGKEGVEVVLHMDPEVFQALPAPRFPWPFHAFYIMYLYI